MSSKKITLKTSDNQIFEVTEEVALKSQTIKHLIEDECANNVIPLPNVTSETLALVIEYCKKHVEEGNNSSSDDAKESLKAISSSSDDAKESLKAISSSSDDAKESLKAFEEAFIKAVDMDNLYDLILAANYLDIKGLLDLSCQTFADMIKGKTPDQIRKHFNIRNDFTPEEEEEVRRENQWAFEIDQ